MTELNNERADITIGEPLFRLLNDIERCLNENNIQGFLVGGLIRDNILKRDIEDIDIAIAADSLVFSPVLARHLNARYIPMDKANKVARLILRDTAKPQHIDVSTIALNIEDDLSKRDFDGKVRDFAFYGETTGETDAVSAVSEKTDEAN